MLVMWVKMLYTWNEIGSNPTTNSSVIINYRWTNLEDLLLRYLENDVKTVPGNNQKIKEWKLRNPGTRLCCFGRVAENGWAFHKFCKEETFALTQSKNSKNTSRRMTSAISKNIYQTTHILISLTCRENRQMKTELNLTSIRVSII